jgi:hypothetical protein
MPASWIEKYENALGSPSNLIHDLPEHYPDLPGREEASIIRSLTQIV